MGFTSNYKTSILDCIAQEDGSLYYLSEPEDIRAIINNKTLFEENE